MTSIARPSTGAVYVVVLRKDLPSPLAPSVKASTGSSRELKRLQNPATDN